MLVLGLLLSELGGIGLVLLVDKFGGFVGFVFCCLVKWEILTINFGFVDFKFVVGKLGGIDLVLLFGKSRELHLGFVFCCLAN